MSRLPASQRYRRHKDRWKRYERPQPGSPRPDRREVHRAAAGLAHGSTTSTRRSTTAPGSASCASTTAATRRPRSSSSTRSWPGCRSGSRPSRPTTARSSSRPSTTTCSTGDRPRLHPAGDAAAQRQGRAVPSDRRRASSTKLLDGVVIDESGALRRAAPQGAVAHARARSRAAVCRAPPGHRASGTRARREGGGRAHPRAGQRGRRSGRRARRGRAAARTRESGTELAAH